MEISGVSIIIPVLNEERYLPELLASLRRISTPLDINVYDCSSFTKDFDVIQ